MAPPEHEIATGQDPEAIARVAQTLASLQTMSFGQIKQKARAGRTSIQEASELLIFDFASFGDKARAYHMNRIDMVDAADRPELAMICDFRGKTGHDKDSPNVNKGSTHRELDRRAGKQALRERLLGKLKAKNGTK